MTHIKLGIELMGAGAGTDSHQRDILEICQVVRSGGYIRKFRASQQNLTERKKRNPLQRFFQRDRCGDHCKINQTVFQGLYCLWCGVIGDAQLYMGILVMKGFQFCQQDQTEGGFAGSDIYQTAFQAFFFQKFIFSGHKLFYGDGYMVMKAFSFYCKLDTSVGADEQFAAQFIFQNVHTAGNIGLIISHYLGSFGKAFILGNIVKNSIVIKDHAL